MIRRVPLYNLAAAFVLAAASNAQVTGTYVDAIPIDLPGGNTVLLSDPADDDFYDGPTADWPPLRSDKWFLFSGDTGIDPLGQTKGRSIEFALFSNCCGFGTPPALLTTISGLEPGGLYDVYVQFIAASWVPGGYGMQAAFEGGELKLFTDADNSVNTNLPGNGIETYEGLVGNTEAVNGEIVVEIHPSGQERNYYAGLSYVHTGSAVVPFDFTVSRGAGSTLVFSWDNQAGKLYNLRSETNPSNGEPIDWPIYDGNADLAADPSGTNTLTIDLPGEAQRLFVVEGFPAPPAVLFNDDFENGQGSWTTGSDGAGAGTAWEFGAPSVVGPTAANSGSNCFATNLAANYSIDAEIWLRSPVIDLTGAGEATLNFAQYTDIEPLFDYGQVAVLDADDDSLLAQIGDPIDDASGGWEEISRAMPSEALGKSVKLEFRFTSDAFNEEPGWYLDDIEVTVP